MVASDVLAAVRAAVAQSAADSSSPDSAAPIEDPSSPLGHRHDPGRMVLMSVPRWTAGEPDGWHAHAWVAPAAVLVLVHDHDAEALWYRFGRREIGAAGVVQLVEWAASGEPFPDRRE